MKPVLIKEEKNNIDRLERSTENALRLVSKLNSIFKKLHPSFGDGLLDNEIENAIYQEDFIKDKLVGLDGNILQNGLELDKEMLKNLIKLPKGHEEFESTRGEIVALLRSDNPDRRLRIDLLATDKGQIILNLEKYNQAKECFRHYATTEAQLSLYTKLKGLADHLNYFLSINQRIDLYHSNFHLLEQSNTSLPYEISDSGLNQIKRAV